MLCDPGLAPTFSDDVNNIVAVHMDGVYYVYYVTSLALSAVSHHARK